MPYLRNHGKQQQIKNSQYDRNVKERNSSEIAEKIRKNAWTNLPELLRQIALANAQKQQQERGGAKMGYLRPVNHGRRDFVPSVLASDDGIINFDNGPQTRTSEQITSPSTHPRGDIGVRSTSKSSNSYIPFSGRTDDDDGDATTNDDKKHLLYHNMQLKGGGIEWTRGIFVKPGNHVPNEHNRYNNGNSNTNRFNSDNYNPNMASNDKALVQRQSAFKATPSNLPNSPKLGLQDIYTNRNGSHSKTRLNSMSEAFSALNDYNRHRYRPKRRNTYTQGLETSEGTEESMQLGTTAPGNRKHFPKRQNNPLDVSERRIDDAIITHSSGLPRQGKQSLFEKQITDSIASLSSEGFTNSKIGQHNRLNGKDRTYQLHREWWKTFQQRSGAASRNPQRRQSRNLFQHKKTRQN